jgi:hypothetical protein
MLVGAHQCCCRVHTSNNGSKGRLRKTHDHRKVRKRTDYRCITSPGGIQVILFIFSRGRHYGKDDRINGGE